MPFFAVLPDVQNAYLAFPKKKGDQGAPRFPLETIAARYLEHVVFVVLAELAAAAVLAVFVPVLP